MWGSGNWSSSSTWQSRAKFAATPLVWPGHSYRLGTHPGPAPRQLVGGAAPVDPRAHHNLCRSEPGQPSQTNSSQTISTAKITQNTTAVTTHWSVSSLFLVKLQFCLHVWYHCSAVCPPDFISLDKPVTWSPDHLVHIRYPADMHIVLASSLCSTHKYISYLLILYIKFGSAKRIKWIILPCSRSDLLWHHNYQSLVF